MTHYFFIFSTLLFQIATTSWVPKIVWSYWDQPLQSESYLELFHLNHLLFAKGWSIRLLNKDNVNYYLKKIPYYQNQIDKLYFALVQYKADYIRLLLLTYYGGVWTDFTNIMTEDFSWLDVKQLRNNPDVLNIYGQEPQVLFFTYPTYGSRETYKHPKTKTQTQISPGYQIWFIASKPDNKFLLQTLSFYKQALEGTKNKNKKEMQNRIDKIIQEQKIKMGKLNHYLLVQQIQQIILQRKQKQLDIINNYHDGDGDRDRDRELAVHYFHIWHIKCQSGPFGVGAVFQNNIMHERVYYVFKFDVQLLRNLGVRFRYFVKIVGFDRDLTKRHLVPGFSDKGDSFNQMMTTLMEIPSYVPIDRYLCPERYTIKPKSIIDKYLLNNNFRNRVQFSQNQSPFDYKCEKLQKFIDNLLKRQKELYKRNKNIGQQLQQIQDIKEEQRNKLQNLQNKLKILEQKQIKMKTDIGTDMDMGANIDTDKDGIKNRDEQNMIEKYRMQCKNKCNLLVKQYKSYYYMQRIILLVVIGLLLLFICFLLYFLYKRMHQMQEMKKIIQLQYQQEKAKNTQTQSQRLIQNNNIT